MKKMKNFVLVWSALTVGLLAAPVATMQTAAATPIIADTAAGMSCTLPDGTQGTTTDIHGTCCPAISQNSPPGSQDGTSCFYDKYVNPLIKLLAALVGMAVVISIIWGGIEYILSEGDPQKAANGKKRIVGALVALVAFIVLFAAMQFLAPGGVLNG